MQAKNAGNVLVVDDDPDVLLTAELLLKERHHQVRVLERPEGLDNLLAAQNVDVVLLDMNFSRGRTNGEEGLHWLGRLKERSPATQVVMTTAYGEIPLAVEALKRGAADFLLKPWDNEKLLATVSACCRLSRSLRKVERLEGTQRLLGERLELEFGEIIGVSRPMQKVFDLIDKVAATDANVLILGENGTGKELVARALHRLSPRAAQPMISVDMGAVAESLFESEMFGHRKGAFTDAREDRMGRFELASGSTLFLDEIGNLSTAAQAKLLGVLESRAITPLGSEKVLPVDIRLVCATNAPIAQLLSENGFRRDLLYRINTVEIHLPPLRERKGDIPLLVDHYLKALADKYHRKTPRVAPALLRKMERYSWPGNVRELRHCLERALIVSEGMELGPADLLLRHDAPVEDDPEFNLATIERKTIERALDEFGGNMSGAARVLGLGRTTLYRKLRKYGFKL